MIQEVHAVTGDYAVRGSPDSAILEQCLDGPGDLWHSGLLRSSAGLLPELKYWRPCGWWYLNDADAAVSNVAWRVDSSAFVVRRSVWECLDGFDSAFCSEAAKGLDFGFRLLQSGGVPLHVPGLFPAVADDGPKERLPRVDVYLFFVRHFKKDYSRYLLVREAIRSKAPGSEWRALREAEQRAAAIPPPKGHPIPMRPLEPIRTPLPTVSVIMPTMGRQAYAADVLEDLARQTLLPSEVFVVDATPETDRVHGIYEKQGLDIPVSVIFLDSPGACRQRNTALRLCIHEYVLFIDDDTRLPSYFIENHVRALETYRAQATTGLVVNADRPGQGLEDMAKKLGARAPELQVRVDTKFSGGNACVRREWAQKCIGNDINFDGGYGEDSDFGQCLREHGAVVLYNPHSPNFHLRAPRGGFRQWEIRSGFPWEFNSRVGWIQPRPGPTVVYGLMKHYTPDQVREWFMLYVLRGWWPRYLKPHESFWKRGLLLGFRILETPLVLLRIRVARRFARDLWRRGPIFE